MMMDKDILSFKALIAAREIIEDYVQPDARRVLEKIDAALVSINSSRREKLMEE